MIYRHWQNVFLTIALLVVTSTITKFAFSQSTPTNILKEKISTTQIGSFAPGVYVEDITYTLRAAYIRSITVSHHNPDVAYAASWDGYVWKTTDGGKTWDESRLILEPRPFYGDSGERLYFGVHRSDTEAWGQLHLEGELPMDKTVLRAGRPTSTHSYLVDKQRRSVRSSQVDIDRSYMDSIDPGSAARIGAKGNVNFGIGLPGRAPRLQLVVRKFGKTTSGLNIKQTLYLRGDRPTEVRIIVIHPNNPKIVFACTMFGLYMTYDGGLNWVRTFQGINPMGRRIFHVAIDPKNDKKILLATGNGLFISTDGGENYIPSTSQGVGGGVIDWIYFNPYNSRYIFVGTDYGLLRSSDGGDNWEWIYFTTFPAARVVTAVVMDPFDKKTGYIATLDGVFYTPNILTGNLEDWHRLGGLRFTGVEVTQMSICPKHKGHMWILTNMRVASVSNPGLSDTGGAFVWETVDSGSTWKVIFSGHTNGAMQWFDNDPKDPDLLWFAWSRALNRMRRLDKDDQQNISPAKEKEIITALKENHLPSSTDVLMAALRYTGTDPKIELGYRKLSRFKSLIPRLDASYSRWNWHNFPTMHDGVYSTLPFLRDETSSGNFDEFKVMLTWNLYDLVFNLQATLFGRIRRVNYEISEYLKFAVHRFYSELKRLHFMMMTKPPSDFRVRLMYKMRIKELESYLDFITGGYLTRYKKGDHPSGWDTSWFETWSIKEKDGNRRLK